MDDILPASAFQLSLLAGQLQINSNWLCFSLTWKELDHYSSEYESDILWTDKLKICKQRETRPCGIMLFYSLIVQARAFLMTIL